MSGHCETCGGAAVPRNTEEQLVRLLRSVPLLVPDNLSPAAKRDGELRRYFGMLAIWLPQAQSALANKANTEKAAQQ